MQDVLKNVYQLKNVNDLIFLYEDLELSNEFYNQITKLDVKIIQLFLLFIPITHIYLCF